MRIWIDAQISPAMAAWIQNGFSVDAKAVRDLGLRDATDEEIFATAKQENVIVMSKDRDFVELLRRLGPPPQVIWVRCGNTSNARLKEILTRTLSKALELLAAGESLVEITAA